MNKIIFKLVGVALLLSASGQAIAQTADVTASSSVTPDPAFAQFVPNKAPVGTKIDYAIWDEALEYFVFRMGRSIRESAPSVNPEMGTRRIYGHDSRLRLEGNRVIFSYLGDDIKTSLSEYRADLENTASLVDISTLGRNEQLAYWINLHNVAVIERIALEYPVGQPSRIKVNGSELPFDETPFINVAGVQMSPKDIRTKIVYPNWKDPKVIYGFFRGEIGGPSIMSDAYTGENVGKLLEDSAKEFVNSLRGTQKSGSKLDVSKIYEEAGTFYFPNWSDDLKAHLLTYSQKEVTEIIENAGEVRARIYETDVSDLANGERDPNYNLVLKGDRVGGFSVPTVIVRLLTEHNQKVQKIMRRNDIEGRVTIIDVGDLTKPRKPEVVE